MGFQLPTSTGELIPDFSAINGRFPENGWLEDESPFAMTYFQGRNVRVRQAILPLPIQKEFGDLNLDTPLKTNGELMVAYHGRK